MIVPRRIAILPLAGLLLAGAAGAFAQAPATQSTAAVTTQPAPFKPVLMAHGTSGRFWIAYVESYKEGGKTMNRTNIRAQALPADQWEELPTVYGHAVALASIQGDLAVLIDDWSWRRVGESVSTGPSIVAGTGPVLAWTSSPQALYGIRAVEGGIGALGSAPSPTTAPATLAATQDAGPSISTRPSAARTGTGKPAIPVLFRYERGQWAALAEVPPAGVGKSLALTIVNNKPVVAVQSSPGVLSAWIRADGGWSEWGQVNADPTTERFGLLATPTSAALWTMNADRSMQLFLRSENDPWAAASAFAVPRSVPRDAHRALTVAGEEFRLVAFKDGKLMQQRYDLTGNPRGELAELPTPRPQQPTPLLWILQSVVLLVMILVMLVTLYRRRSAAAQTQQQDSEE
jgi:hypothetical protein